MRDNGIGMGRDEVVENIGTIARSGTRRFLESMSGDSRKDTQLIGQFGVGFYSAFVVADQVTLESRRAGAPAGEGVRWSSAGQGEYSIEDCELAQRGTTVTLHLKEGEDEFLDGWRLRSLVSRYSDHIGFPIRLPKEPDGSGEPEVVNQASALWTRPKAAIKDEEYQEFYRYLAHDTEAPLAWAHNRVEGNQSYTTLLYLPAKAPWDALYSGRDERKGLKLYVRRVFIMDASEQLLPAYLRFVKGVVDSDDLPLNVSRELLQDNRLVAQIRAACIKRTLDLLDKLAADEPAKFAEFSRAFGNVLKEGVAEDYANRERVAKLLRFASTRGEGAEKSVALDDYVARMAEGQKAIWYVTADSWAAAAGSPQLEALKAAGIEVLLMHDRIDEWMAGYLREYAGKPLQHVAKGELDLPETGDPQQRAADAAAVEPALERLRKLLGERVREVRAGSPAGRFAGLPGAGRARHGAAPATPVPRGRPGRARYRAAAGDQSGQSAGAPAGDRGRRGARRGSGLADLRAGAHHRRRDAGGSRRIRRPAQPAARVPGLSAWTARRSASTSGCGPRACTRPARWPRARSSQERSRSASRPASRRARSIPAIDCA